MAGKERECMCQLLSVSRQKGDNESWHMHAFSLSKQKLSVMAFGIAPFFMVSRDWAQGTS